MEEVIPEGYEQEVSQDVRIFTNTVIESDLTQITVQGTKTWLDYDGGELPESITTVSYTHLRYRYKQR